MTFFAVLLAVAVTAIALGAGHAGSAPMAWADCSSEARPNRHGTKVLDRVYFGGFLEPGWEQGDATQRDPARGGRWFTKVGLLVRGDDPVLLELPPHKPIEFVGWFGEEPAKSRIIDLAPAPPCGEREWFFDAGGFLYRARHCAKVDVTVDGRTKRVPFGLGKDCPRAESTTRVDRVTRSVVKSTRVGSKNSPAIPGSRTAGDLGPK